MCLRFSALERPPHHHPPPRIHARRRTARRGTGAVAARTALAHAAQHYASLHIAPSSARTYDVGARAYAVFSVFFRPGRPAFPASDEALQHFVTFQSQSCQYSTLKTYLYGVRDFQLARGMPFAPLAERLGLWWTLRGIRRSHGRPAQPKQALTFRILLDVWRAATTGGRDQMETDTHVVFTAMLVGMFGMLRKNNLTADKARAAHGDARIRRSDVTFREGRGLDGAQTTVMWIRIRSSKTNQYGERVQHVPFVQIGGALCPVSAVRRLLQRVPGGPEDPLFTVQQRQRAQRVPLTHATFVRRMKGLLQTAGHNPAAFAGHSLRRGGATMAFRLGVPRHLIKVHGDWLSDVVDHYNEMDPATRLHLPLRMAQHAASLYALRLE